MIVYIFIAIFNGVVIGLGRAINGKLSLNIGALKASFWNHMTGFILLLPIFMVLGDFNFKLIEIPYIYYLGGVFGAMFVAVNSYILPKLGAVKTTLLVISAQIVSGVFIENQGKSMDTFFIQIFGVVIILLGIYLSTKRL